MEEEGEQEEEEEGTCIDRKRERDSCVGLSFYSHFLLIFLGVNILFVVATPVRVAT